MISTIAIFLHEFDTNVLLFPHQFLHTEHFPVSCYCTPSLLLPRYCCCNVQSCCRSAAARVCSISACLTITGLTCGSGAAAACVGYLVPPVATILAQDLLNDKQGVVTELVHAAAFNSRCGNWRGRQSAAMFSRPEILHPPLNVTIFISPWTGSYPMTNERSGWCQLASNQRRMAHRD